ncbi:MAG: hypothetical protein R3C97_12235 [Geminicoccaceae bacterium]
MTLKPLDPSELRRRCDPATLGFATTASLDPVDGLIGQRPVRSMLSNSEPISMRAVTISSFWEHRDRAGMAPFAVSSKTRRKSVRRRPIGSMSTISTSPTDRVRFPFRPVRARSSRTD